MDSSFNQRNEPLLHDELTIKNQFVNNKNTQNNFLDNNQNEIIENLIFMGFNIEIIDMCFCFFTINTIEQAVQIMSKEKDIWQHDYIKSENTLCIICNEFSDHKNFIIDKEKKLEKLKELNDSFNSKFRSSIEYLRESKANRCSINSTNKDLISINENKNSNIFEININFKEKTNNQNDNYKIKYNANVNNRGKTLITHKNLENFDLINNDDYVPFDETNSIDEKAYLKPLNKERRKFRKFNITDNIQISDIGELQNNIIINTEEELKDNAELINGILKLFLLKI